MADILIPNMKMPTGEKDFLEIILFGDGSVGLKDDLMGINKHTDKAIELPSHGRLVDADKILTESGYDPMMFQPKYGGDHRTQYDTLMGYEILGIIEDAPTVVEATT